MTRWCTIGLAISLLAFVASAGAEWAFHDRLPEQVPIHYGLDGQADGWASKDQTFVIYYLLPTIMGGIVVLGYFVLPWLSPQKFAVAAFRQTYDYVFMLVAALFASIQACYLSSICFGGEMPERLLLAGIFVFFALIGNVLGKVKRNFWMGIRTPWTLADAQVWERTHRVGAWSFTAVGVIGATAALLGLSPTYCFFGLIAGALWPVAYSLMLYKRLERAGKLDAQRHDNHAAVVNG